MFIPVLREKSIAFDIYTRKSESSKNSDLNFNLREVKKDIKPKPSMTRMNKRLKTKKGKKI